MDEALLRWINEHHAEWLDGVMLTLSNRWLGVALVVAFALPLLRRGEWWTVIIIGLALAMSDVGGAHLVKPAFLRERPCFALEGVRTLYEQSHSPSMPSLHSANAATFAALLMFMRRFRVGAAAAVITLLVGYSRVYLGVHWPSDVLAGYAWGALCAAAVWLTISRYAAASPSP